jgi:FlaA1/EpsC-like NDP-sugar epimerase
VLAAVTRVDSLAKLRGRRAALLLGHDVLAVVLAYVVATVLRYELAATSAPWRSVALLMLVSLVAQWITRETIRRRSGRVPVASVDETLRLSLVMLFVVGVAQLVNSVLPDPVGRSVPAAAGFMAFTAMVFGRAAWRVLAVKLGYVSSVDRRRTIVIGAGVTGHQLVRSMRTSPRSTLAPVALLDDDPWKQSLRLDGVPVKGRLQDLAKVATSCGATDVVIAIASASGELLAQVSDDAAKAGLRVKVLPSAAEMLDEQVTIRDVRDLNMADILGRGAIDTDVDSIAHFLEGKRVLVTGAGGSIGAELSRQISKWRPAELMLLDRDESALHGVQLTIHGHGLLNTRDVILADIRDRDALQRIFEDRRPEVVFHAAALKHLPMLEQYPLEGIKTNVLGTLNVLAAAESVGVERFVNISTDKAADPTSVLGQTKRVAERLTATYAHHSPGVHLSVRFGNVLGSRGSVLTAWTAQIAAGGPITVTHPDVTRYFMTIAEACQLVLQAGAIGSNGEALILDMGEPIRLDDVARQLIRQSGADMDIVYTGLREGEKMHEVLISESEEDNRPHHELITHVEVAPVPEEAVAGADLAVDVASARKLLDDWCTAPVAVRLPMTPADTLATP